MSAAPLSFSVLPGGAGKALPARLAGIAGGGEALLLAELYRRQKKPLLFIAASALEAYHVLEELLFFAPEVPAHHLPDWETLPYDAFSPTAEIIAKRISALAALLEQRDGITVTTVPALLLPCAPPAFIAGRTFALKVGEALDMQAMQQRLHHGGYQRTDRVLTTGEYAVYGGQIDIYPPDARYPLRLVLCAEEIEQIRLFDPESQRSLKQVESYTTLPVSECDLSPEGRQRFAEQYHALFDEDSADLCRRLRSGENIAGIEYYLPLFFSGNATLFDYLPGDIRIVMPATFGEAADGYLHQARLRQKIAGTYDNRQTLPVSALCLSAEECCRRLRQYSVTILNAPADETRPPPVAANARAKNAHAALLEFIAEFSGSIVIAVDGEGRAERLYELLGAEGVAVTRCDGFADCLAHHVSLTVAPLRGGFILPAQRLAVLTESEIYQTQLPPRARRVGQQAVAGLLADEIKAGDYVAHREYGIGKVHGLKNMEVGGHIGEYLEIEYAETQRLFLPVSQLHLLEAHHGNTELSKMGNRGWKRLAARAAAKAYDAAAQLLEINARRAAAEVRGHRPDELLLARFIEAFEHEETPDQQRAAEEVLQELRADKPMDRLIAADVGFGKTEIAARAAAAVAFGGGQALLMAPTTLLVQQHMDTFADRFAGFPVRLASLTRLTSMAQRRELTRRLAAGQVDIVIGTHALLNKKLKYQSLGLVVIDEEHRFGVTHKERIKNMRAGVDMLSLSATPIPRTLSMALGGIRDISIISTPPASRLHIKTIDAPFSHSVVHEACERELMRGGQIFFIHNEIRSINDIAQQLAKWLPQARIIIAHGGMSGHELENAMRRFVRRQGEILLCTTIVESGLDIANANTILINRADRMGLSRLHQLRGRVGRSNVQAYAYFLRPMDAEITDAAESRLAAAREHSTQGGGFFLSMRDLEIRGAGEILGERQSGEIEAVGYAMYQRMVNAAARQLRNEPAAADSDVTIELAAPALLPDTYVPSPAERMRYYRRLHAGRDEAALNEIFLEWEDRFGKPPPPAQLLKESYRLRLLMTACLAEELRVDKSAKMTLSFNKATPCSQALIDRITVGACAAVSASAVSKRLTAAEPVEQVGEIMRFLRELQAAGETAAAAG